ncbi:hypothetical protein [Paractinoplanes maris]|uniref:hypothetical protein n=1 Tax=Paractinoplanes maris TaxID=1734446 RepID=UPI0020209F5B|nr:hypothetical protein [Actinoplanes maris]
MSSGVVSARQVLDRFDGGDGSAAPSASPAERVAWAGALIDTGDLDAATDQLTAALLTDASVPVTLLAVVRRLTGRHARSMVRVAIDSGRVTVMSAEFHPRPVAGALAHLAAGSDEAEEALLRAALVVGEYEDHAGTGYRRHRAHRIAAVLAVLADAHRGEPERLDLWAAILGEADRPRLLAAAGLLGPLGLAEIDRRCGEPDDETDRYEAVPAVRALAESGRLTEALELAARLQPYARQESLVAVAQIVTDDSEARTVVAAFRKCPKVSRERGQQGIHRHRLALVLLTFGRIDDALSELAKMRDCRYVGFGPAELVAELVQWFGQRPEEATAQRVRALLDVLLTPNVIHQDLAEQVAGVLHRVFVLADPALRTEIVDTYAVPLRAKLRSEHALVDVGLAAGLLTIGRAEAAMDVLRAGAAATSPGRRLPHMAHPLIEAAMEADLAGRHPDLFDELFGTIAALAFSLPPSSWDPAVRLGAAGRETAARQLDRFTVQFAGRWADWLAAAAAETGDFDTLHTLLENATGQPWALMISRHLAGALQRHGDAAAAHALANVCGLQLTPRGAD